MIRQVVPALRILLVMTLLTGVVYPLAVTGVTQTVWSSEANGSLVLIGGAVVGSELLGQEFADEAFFHPRPSAVEWNGAGSGGSNLGPTNPALADTVRRRVVVYRDVNGLDPGTAVPVDGVTASASGLDPHISVANARLQAPRVATVRGRDLQEVLALIEDHTAPAQLGLLSIPAVNVLALNLALDSP